MGFSQDIDIQSFANFDKLKTKQNESDTLANNNQIGFNVDFFSGSNALNNEFINTFYKGGFLNNELKRSVALKQKNVFGSNNNISFFYDVRADSILKISNSTLRFSLSNNIFTDIVFNDDVYNLLFFGNAQTTNADLSGLKINHLMYQKFTVGLHKSFGNTNVRFGSYVGLSLVKGQNFLTINVPSGELITSEFGTLIESNINYELNRSDTISSSYTNWLGTGVAGDFYFSINNIEKNTELSFRLTNLGRISWNEKSLSTNLDTSISTSGRELTNLLDFSSSESGFLHTDSITKEFIDDKTFSAKTNTMLPAVFALNYHFKSNTLHSDINLGAQKVLFSNMLVPFFYLRADTKLSNSLNGIIQFAYGGYANFQLGIGLEAIITDRLFIHVFTSNISAFLIPKSTFGQQMNIAAYYKFGGKQK